MRSLNTSLPGGSGTSSRSHVSDPPEQLLTAFKAAALSVTNLYKSAAADERRARSEGYQDALDDLLTFLDKAAIGLGDGEGWRVRRWATERLHGRESALHDSDDETDKTERASSPIIQRSQSSTRISTTPVPPRTESPGRAQPQPASVAVMSNIDEASVNLMPQSTFTFRSTHNYPEDAEMILSDLDISDNVRTTSHDAPVSFNASSTPGIALPRQTRSRHSNSNPRISQRSPSSLGRGVGQKRRIDFDDFFEIDNTRHGKDGFGGGGKRGRFA